MDSLLKFAAKDTTPEAIRRIMTRGNIQLFLDNSSASYEQFRGQVFANNSSFTIDTYEKYRFNQLYRYPVIISQRNKLHTIPVAHLFYSYFTNGIFHILREAFSIAGEQGNKFSEFFGKNLFEEYVSRLFASVISTPVYKEISYNKGQKLSADWMIEDNNTLTLIECKTSDLRQDSKTYANIVEIEKDLKKNIVKGIISNERTRNAISDNRNIEFEHIRHVNKTFSVVVIYSESLFNNSPPMRSCIDKLLQEELPYIPKYHIMDINEFEYFIASLQTFSISELLETKENNTEWYTLDFGLFIKKYADQKGLPVPDLIPSLLRERWKKFYKGLSNKGT